MDEQTEELISRLNARAHDPARAVDERAGASAPATRPTAMLGQIAQAEAALGFPLPLLLREVYGTIGSGGFGPGFGLLPVPADFSYTGETLVSRYAQVRQAKSRLAWPAGLLPVCDWGTGIVSCLDCTRPDTPVIRIDPNMPKADETARVPAHLHFDRAARLTAACWVESPSLRDWLSAWADGRPLFYAAYGDPDDDADEEEEDDEDGDEADPA